MQITKVTEISRQKYRVELDEEIAFVLYKGDLSQYGIVENGELSEETYSALLNETLYERAKKQFANMIASKDMTIHMTREYLERKEYPSEVIDRVIELGIRERFLDDRRYAAAYVDCYAGRKSARVIREDLKHRGIPAEILEICMESVSEESEQEAIRKLLRKKLGDSRSDSYSYEEKQKLTAFLMRKGFSYDAVRQGIREFLS